MIELTDIAYVRSGAADLAGRGRLRHPHRRPGARRRRRAGRGAPARGRPPPLPRPGRGRVGRDRHRLHGGRRGRPRAGRDRAGAARVHRHPRRRRARAGHGGCGEFIGLDDPFGNRIELVAGQQSLGRPVAFSRRAGITEFGHVCLDAPDVHEAYRFWSTTFNAKVSDWIGDGACLMRIDPGAPQARRVPGRRAGPVPHELPGRRDRRRLPQLALPARPRRRDRDGPGRHPQSTAVFLYFLGPEGFTYEYSFGVRRIEDDAAWRPRILRPGRARLDRHVARPHGPHRLPAPGSAAVCRSPRRKPGRSGAAHRPAPGHRAGRPADRPAVGSAAARLPAGRRPRRQAPRAPSCPRRRWPSSWA